MSHLKVTREKKASLIARGFTARTEDPGTEHGFNCVVGKAEVVKRLPELFSQNCFYTYAVAHISNRIGKSYEFFMNHTHLRKILKNEKKKYFFHVYFLITFLAIIFKDSFTNF